jgi:LuxR family maltose regulon positive regulatory protein
MVAQGERIAWLSLDDDDDVWQFIPYLLQALRPLYADWDADFWRDGGRAEALQLRATAGRAH